MFYNIRVLIFFNFKDLILCFYSEKPAPYVCVCVLHSPQHGLYDAKSSMLGLKSKLLSSPILACQFIFGPNTYFFGNFGLTKTEN